MEKKGSQGKRNSILKKNITLMKDPGLENLYIIHRRVQNMY